MRTSIDTVWARIRKHQREIFCQIRGKKYRYSVVGAAVVPGGINQNIPKAHFEQALSVLPLSNTVTVQHLRGPSYIYSILMDPRVRGDDEWGTK